MPNNEFLMNMKSIPDKSSQEYDHFWDNERQKAEYGLTVNGVHIPGWLYWHTQLWHIYKNIEDPVNKTIKRVSDTASFRDNEWVIAEAIEEAEKERKGVMIFGARRLGKSEIIASYLAHGATLFEGTENVIMGGNWGDIDIIMAKVVHGLNNLPDYFKFGRLAENLRKEIELGFKDKKGTRLSWSKIVCRNHEDGNKTESPAGLTPFRFIMDEIAKSKFSEVLDAAKPSFTSEYGWRCSPILTGCVCKGTKVWTNNGDLINIEDLTPAKGILGYNEEEGAVSKETITYWQPPADKPCYRIQTSMGKVLECSDDHPILVLSRSKTYGVKDKRGKRKILWVEAKDLDPTTGDQIAVIDEVPIFGNKQMWQPRLIGWLIGDGGLNHDGPPVLSSCDYEITDYIKNNFEHTIRSSRPTKDGKKQYEEIAILKIRPYLKDYGILNKNSHNKVLPPDIHLYNKESLQELLGGLYDTDGCYYVNSKIATINLTSVNRELLEQVLNILVKFGIHGKIKYEKYTSSTAIAKSKNGWYVLRVSDRKSLLNFKKYIIPYISYKKDNLQKIYDLVINKKNKIPSHTKGLRFERIKSVEYIGVKPVYNLTAGCTNTYIANNIVTHNTSGDIKNVTDAQNYFDNPDANNFIVRHLPEEGGRKSSVFISGLYRMEGKVDTTLGNYIENDKGILLPKDSELFTIPMQVKDDAKALAIIEEERRIAEKSSDVTALLKQKMYYPLNTQELFLTDSGNNFPLEAIQEHIAFLEANPVGQPCELYRDSDNKVRINWNTSKKGIDDYPIDKSKFNDYKKDAAVIIYERPTDVESYFLYISGLDSYNMSSSKWSHSLGSIFIYKRTYDPVGGTFQRRIVAEYTARPESMKIFHDNCIMLLELYNATCMIENEAQTTIQYFDLNNKGTLLADGFSLLKEIHPSTSITNRTKGLPATKPVQRHYKELIFQYLTEEVVMDFDKEGNPIKKLGVVRIPSIGLLKELLNYNDEGNFDRYVAFGHVLTYEAWADKMYPVVDNSPSTNETFIVKKNTSSPFNKGFGNVFGNNIRKNPFS